MWICIINFLSIAYSLKLKLTNIFGSLSPSRSPFALFILSDLHHNFPLLCCTWRCGRCDLQVMQSLHPIPWMSVKPRNLQNKAWSVLYKGELCQRWVLIFRSAETIRISSANTGCVPSVVTRAWPGLHYSSHATIWPGWIPLLISLPQTPHSLFFLSFECWRLKPSLYTWQLLNNWAMSIAHYPILNLSHLKAVFIYYSYMDMCVHV